MLSNVSERMAEAKVKESREVYGQGHEEEEEAPLM